MYSTKLFTIAIVKNFFYEVVKKEATFSLQKWIKLRRAENRNDLLKMLHKNSGVFTDCVIDWRQVITKENCSQTLQ